MFQDNSFSMLRLLPSLYMAALFLLGTFTYGFRNVSVGAKLRKLFGVKTLVRAAVYFRVAYAGLLTVLQYYAWTKMGVMGDAFLAFPLPTTIPESLLHSFSWMFSHPLGYFIFYSFERFWLNVILALGVAWAFHAILTVLRKYNKRFFDDDEVELGYLMALIVGWPVFVLFVLFVFLFVVLFALVRLTVMREEYTTLGWPCIVAAATCIFFSAKIFTFLGLNVLSV